MSDGPQHEAHRRPHTPPMADPFMEFDLPAEIHRLHEETTWTAEPENVIKSTTSVSS
jgi:hypothetical protein